MTKQRLRATSLVAAGVVAGGILTGTLGAHAADDTDSRPDTAQAGMPMPGPHRGPGEARGGEDLAKALGVTEEKLRAAFEAVRDDVKPIERSPEDPPSATELRAQRDKMTAALAKELGLSEAKVEAAFKKVHKAHAAERRADLSDRLDAAVKHGKLTKADRASVLKAFDAGVLGGPGPRQSMGALR